jgi:hypothetical protein
MLQAGRSPVRVPDEMDSFNLSNRSSPTMALGVDSASNRNEYTKYLPGGKKRPARGADNLAAMCEPNI